MSLPKREAIALPLRSGLPEEVIDAELVEVPSPFESSELEPYSPFGPTQRSTSAKASSSAEAPKKSFAPQRPYVLRTGIILFVVGYLTALVAVICLANGSQTVKLNAEWVHRGSLFLMLAGAGLVMAGYRRK